MHEKRAFSDAASNSSAFSSVFCQKAHPANSSLASDPIGAYQVETSPHAHRIFDRIDQHLRRFPHARQSFDAYTNTVQSFVRRKKQPYHEFDMRIRVYEMLRKIIEPYFDDGYLALGGSTLNEISTWGGDLDLCFAIKSSAGVYDEDLSPYVLSKIKGILDESPIVANVRYISARVPILKIDLEFPYQDVNIDINCNCVAGIFNSHLIHYFSKLDQRFVQMNIVLKEWGKVNNVIDGRYGKINSYTMSLMILHYLQCGVYPPILPNLYRLFPQYFDGRGDVDALNYHLDLVPSLPVIPINNRTIGELIYGFFEYFSRFDYDNWWISIKEGRIFSRSDQPEHNKQFLFYLEEAYDGMTVPKNLTKRYKLMEIVKEFQKEREVILVDLFGRQIQPPTIDTSNDYTCESDQSTQQ